MKEPRMASFNLTKVKERYRTSTGFRWAVDLSVLAVLVVGVGLYQTRNHPRGPAPTYSFTTLEQGTVSFASFAGKPTLVAVWAPWCGVCKAASANVSRARRWLGDTANVISVATQFADVSQVRAYVKNQSVDYPVLVAGDDFAQVMKVGAFPTLYVLDAQGNIVSSGEGYTTTLGLLWRAWTAG
jgi:thiol-disulfide isomerase/thioredoxin